MSWRRLGLGASALRLDITLACGQAFAWTQREGVWTAVVRRSVVRLRQRGDDGEVLVALPVCGDGRSEDDVLRDVRGYLRAEEDIAALYAQWAAADPERFARLAPVLPGLRLLRQDPVECLFSFICSSNNHIPRITAMIGTLRERYGDVVGDVDGQTFHAFPTVAQLATAREADLRAAGFGYRAAFVTRTAAMLLERGGDAWLESLRGRPAADVVAELVALHGIGPKVADCIALFSLDCLDLVPVDTHVAQIARHYTPPAAADAPAEAKSMTPKRYKAVQRVFRDRFGERAGWAHCVLFAADLPAFQDMLPPDLRRVATPKRGKGKGKGKGKGDDAETRKRRKLDAELAEADASQ